MYTVKELAEYLGYTERTIYNMIDRGDISYIKIGREYRFKSEDIEKWLSGKTKLKDKGLAAVKEIDNPLKKRLYFMGLLTNELRKYDVRPVLIGGNAVEFYTAGGYATYDIDIAAPSEQIDNVLKSWDFIKEGHYWFNEDLDIQLEAPAFALEPEQLKKLTELAIENLKVYIIGIEDIIVDRLNAYIYWKSKDDRSWAKEMMANNLESIDWEYLKSRADEKVKKEIAKLRKEIK